MVAGMNVGLADFVRMAGTLDTSSSQKSRGMPADKPLTIRVLSQLLLARSTSAEVALAIGEAEHKVAGTMCNLRRQNFVRPVAEISSRTRPTYVYAITNTGIDRLKQWRGE